MTQSPISPPDRTTNPSQPKSGFFEEHNGSKSSMRLMSFVSLLAAITFGVLTITDSAGENGQSSGVTITFGFLISAFAPKAVQKFAEQKVQ